MNTKENETNSERSAVGCPDLLGGDKSNPLVATEYEAKKVAEHRKSNVYFRRTNSPHVFEMTPTGLYLTT